MTSSLVQQLILLLLKVKLLLPAVSIHVHFINPEQAEVALESGITTHIGGGTGASEGAKATTVTPGPWHIHRMLEAAEEMPINVGFTGKGQAVNHTALIEQIHAGAIGLKVHEDWELHLQH